MSSLLEAKGRLHSEGIRLTPIQVIGEGETNGRRKDGKTIQIFITDFVYIIKVS